MEQGTERHYFAGGNTSLGFYSYYSNILPQKEAEHIYILKSGPGTGKSEFIANIGRKLQNSGISAEYIHSPFDPESLDGLKIPELNTLLIDGTPPHTLDPQNPGAIDEIISLGDFLKESVFSHKTDILEINEQLERLYKRVYRYLSAAACVMGDLTDMYGYALDGAAAYAQAAAISEKEFASSELSPKWGGTAKMFLSAITPKGAVHYADTLFGSDYKFYLIVSNWGVGVSAMLKRIAAEAGARGLFTEEYYCPMGPEERLEHLIIPEKKLAFISENRYLKIWRRPDAVIDMMGYSDLRNGKDEIGFAEASMSTLLNEAIYTLKEAKDTRGELKKLYIPNMDFEGVNKKTDIVFESIMKTAKKE